VLVFAVCGVTAELAEVAGLFEMPIHFFHA
jgi:hypothetical protein